MKLFKNFHKELGAVGKRTGRVRDDANGMAEDRAIGLKPQRVTLGQQIAEMGG